MLSASAVIPWVLFVLLCLVFLAGCGFFVLYFLARKAFHIIFDRPLPLPAYDRSPTEINQDTIYGRGQNWFYSNRLDFEDVKMTSYDGLSLAAYYLPAKEADTKRLVILIHGWKDVPANMAAFAQMYLKKMDCHILIVHMRTHGMSEGRYIGYGLSESQDILMWTALMEERLPGPLNIIYHGFSMGAATALIAAGSRRLPRSVVGLIADSPYDSFEKLVGHLIRKRYRFAPRIFLRLISHFSTMYIGYTMRQISPAALAKQIEVPVLLIHGTADTFIPPHMSEVIYNRLQSPKRIFLVQDAEHVMSYDIAPSSYSAEVDQFLQYCGIV